MTKLDLIKNLPTPLEMSQVIPTLKALHQKIQILEKKVLRLEAEKKQPQPKTKRFRLF